jgi:hypothetical protein
LGSSLDLQLAANDGHVLKLILVYLKKVNFAHGSSFSVLKSAMLGVMGGDGLDTI